MSSEGSPPGAPESRDTASGPSDPRDAYFDVSALRRDMGRRIGNASILILGISMMKMVMLFAGIMITARLIPPSEYGIFALAMPTVAVALSLSNFGLPQAIVQRRHVTHIDATTLFWMNLAFAVLAALALAGCATLAGRIFDEPRVIPVYRVIAVSVVFAAVVGQYGAMMRRRLRIPQFEILILLGEAAGLAVAIVTALMGWSYWALVAQQIAAQAATMLLAVIITGWLPSGPHRARPRQVLDALSFGGYVAGQGILNKLIQYSGTAIAGAQLGPAATGLYTRAVRLGNLPPLRIMQPLSGTFVPALSRLQDDPEAMQKMFVRLISRANLILQPVAVIIAAGADPLVAILLGPTWMEAAPLLFWMSILTLRASANQGLRYAVLASGQSKPLFFNSLFRLALISLVVYVASDYGLEAMTAAYMLTELLITLPVAMLLAVRYTPITFNCILRASLGGMVFTVAVAAALIVFVNPWLSDLPALVHLAGLGVLTGLIFALRIALSPEMRQDVLGVLRRVAARLPGGGRAPE
ncbi:MAG: oligosaccharide flippase family protein [Rhodobacteraceae bacterium]|nr:oligosaccharide flippase family protein [Paracoccaceae bacterium]